MTEPSFEVAVEVIAEFAARSFGFDEAGMAAIAPQIRDGATALTQRLADAGLLRTVAPGSPAQGMVYISRGQDENRLMGPRSQQVHPSVILDWDDDSGDLVGIEVTDATEITLDGLIVKQDSVTVTTLPAPGDSADNVQENVPADDPIGTLRIATGDHLFMKLAQPANEPWHLVYSVGQQRWDGWQSDIDMIGTARAGRVPVELAYPESSDAELNAVAQALHRHGVARDLCDESHGWAWHQHQAYMALLAAPRRELISHTQLNLVVNEFSHACPHCPPEVDQQWVVHTEDLPEIVNRLTGLTIDPAAS